MFSVDDASTLHASFDEVPALVIPYFDADGEPLKNHSGWPDFYRIRYLQEPKMSFKKMTGKERGKYAQPPRTGTAAYFPKGYVDWSEVKTDSYVDLIITEGEFKAAKACKEGFPTIGLGGVWNFRSSSHGLALLPELAEFDWVFRKVSIIFDSDSRSKPQIMEAMMALTEELNERGAVVRTVTLPDVYNDGEKTGIDDFLVHRNDVEFADLLSQGLHLNAMETLMDMNLRFVYVEDTGIVIDMEQERKFPLGLFTESSTWAVRKIVVTKFKKDGNSTIEQVNSAKAWATWPLRNTVDGITYVPGEKKFVTEGNERTLYNEWKGWAVEPLEGDVTPFTELLDFLFIGADIGDKEWFVDWLAHSVQHPAVKMFSAVMLHGRVHGTGKTLVFYTMGRIFGDNFFEVSNEELNDTWWLAGKNFVLGDEITGSDRRKDADKLKSMVTRAKATVNIKFMPQYVIPDYVNYGFTSNHPAPMMLEDSDRRTFVHEVKARRPLSNEFYSAYMEWMDGDGPAHLFHWLLARDISHFNPAAPARATAAKREMTKMGKSDMELWCSELIEDPDSKMYVGRDRTKKHVRDLFLTKDLMDMYVADTQPQFIPSKNAFSRTLKSAGGVLAYRGNPISGRGIISNRYWAVRNFDKWFEADKQDCIANILKEPRNVARKSKSDEGERTTRASGEERDEGTSPGGVPPKSQGSAPGRRRKL